MKSTLKNALERLTAHGWRCTFAQPTELHPTITARYPWLPEDVVGTTRKITKATEEGERTWLLTAADYNGNSDSAFAWNEWEKITLDAAASDMDEITSIKRFWDNHFPVAMSVESDYGYYALKKDGSIVFGVGPDFEEPEAYASDYLSFLMKLANASNSLP